jgi:glycosyltransferase involved in cell wall biosynthesis
MIGHLRFGAGKHIVETMLEQSRRGQQVRLVVSPDVDDYWKTDPLMRAMLIDNGMAVYNCGDFFHRNLSTLRETAKKLKELIGGAPALFHCHSAMPAAVAHWSGSGPVVVTCHGMSPGRDPAFDLQDALAFQLADAVISPSRGWAECLEKQYGIQSVKVIPYGMDLHDYPEIPIRSKSKSEPWKILSLCELTRRKGVDLMIESAPEVAKIVGPIEFHIFGTGDDEKNLKAQAANLPIGNHRLFFHGRIFSPYNRLQEFDLLCLPTRSDNFPLAIMEAMLAGLPVLSTQVGGIPEMVMDSGCGLVVPPESAAALELGLIKLLKSGADRLHEMSNNGKMHARRFFRIEHCADSLQEIYSCVNRGEEKNRKYSTK